MGILVQETEVIAVPRVMIEGRGKLLFKLLVILDRGHHQGVEKLSFKGMEISKNNRLFHSKLELYIFHLLVPKVIKSNLLNNLNLTPDPDLNVFFPIPKNSMIY
jgi:hypothetical protein